MILTNDSCVSTKIKSSYNSDIHLRMSVFTHHRRFHGSRHWHYFNQSEKSPGSLAELLWRRQSTESYTWHGEVGRSQAYRLYCQPFSSQLSKAKTSEGHFQSQIDHSTQGKPLKKASRRPREQNASLYGLYRNRPTREAGRPPARLPASGRLGRLNHPPANPPERPL